MDSNENKLCDKCGLRPQQPAKPKTCGCKPKKCCKKKDCCNDNEFAFRKVVIPTALGDDVTGQAKPENGNYTNSYVEYEANGAQYMYDSYGVYTKIEGSGGGGGTLDFNQLKHRPKYAGERMTGDTDIPDVNTAVANEATAREMADNGLQSQIDAISASSDVTDIVGTYAELQNYDTSTLSNNDIIKVLQDEEHNDETTYYRWSTATETFTLIGEEGPYYTKSAANAKFQDKLTAGANVSIDQSTNTISATDTTYADFVGTDGTSVGTAGLVPAPAVSDTGKYLKSDGTWDSMSSGIPTDATFWGASYDSANNSVSGSIRLGGNDIVGGTFRPYLNSTNYIGFDGSNQPIFKGSNVQLVGQAPSSSNEQTILRVQGTTANQRIFFRGATDVQTIRLSGITDPTAAQDAATKNYVDTQTADVALISSTLSTPSSVAYVATDNIQDGAVTADKVDFTTYSTTEQVVGTWIDGKPIYRRVTQVIFNGASIGSVREVPMDIGFVPEEFVKIDGTIQYSSTLDGKLRTFSATRVTPKSSIDDSWGWYFSGASTSFRLETPASPGSTDYKWTMIYEYTKTTD